LKLHITETTEFGNDTVFEWIGEDKRFILWFDDKECDVIFVTRNHNDPDGDYSEKLDRCALEKLYNRVGKLLNYGN
jgi:hypothetical protein